MSKQHLDKEGLQVVVDKVKNKQDKFEVGTSLEFVTVGEGEIDEVLYAGVGNVLTDELPSSVRTNITVNDPEKALSIANQLVQVQFFGFIDATMVSITALSPQTSVGAVKGDVVDLKEPTILLPYTNSVSHEYNEWCSAHGVSFNIPWENNDTLTVYLSCPTLSITRTLDYKPNDTQLSEKSSWSSSHTRDVITSLLPLPFANSDTATIEESSVPTWSDVEKVERNDEIVDTSPTIVDNYLLQKFLWNTTASATELPQTMEVELEYREIYIGVYGYIISCNGLTIGRTIDAPNEGSAIFENAVGITWDYWNEGTYTVTFDNPSDCPVQKVNVTNAVDEEAREVAAGAVALAQEAIDSIDEANNHHDISESITRPTNLEKYSAKWKEYSFNYDEEYESDLNELSGCNIWTDGYDIYASYYRNTGSSEKNCQYRLDKKQNKWVPMTWLGFDRILGEQVWTDGEHIYYSFQGDDYELDVPSHTWSVKTWNGVSNLLGSSVWSDGIHIYSSRDRDHYELVLGTDNWVSKTWNIRFSGNYVWTDGKGNIFMIDTGEYYQLNKSTGNWEEMTWDTHGNDLLGYDVWTDGYNVYHSCAPDNMKFNSEDKSWEVVTFEVLDEFDGENVWSDGKNIYCSLNLLDDSYVLCKSIQIDCRPKL